MRIKSNFHDYYDCGQRYGQDRSLVYVRYAEERYAERGWGGSRGKTTGLPFAPTTYSAYVWQAGSDTINISSFIVGFCGKLYGGLKVWGRDKDGNEFKAICYTAQAVDKVIQSRYKKSHVDEYFRKPRHHMAIAYRHSWSRYPTQLGVADFFKRVAKYDKRYRDFFVDKKCPIFVAEERSETPYAIYHACLKGYEFFRVIDAYTAFQEVAMFMGNLASPEKDMIQTSDEVRLEAHGFDKKESFRKPPQNKRKR